MANYIDRNILCQAYIHVEPVELKGEKLENFKDQIENFIELRGKFFLYADIESEVETREGSLKVYATLAGTLYLAIGQYGSFRSGLDYLSTDVKRLGESIVNESLFLARSKHESVLRVEARLGVVGSLKKIVDNLDYIEKQMGISDVHNLALKLRTTKEDIAKLLENLKDPLDIPYVRNNLQEIVNETLPKQPLPPRKRMQDMAANTVYRQEVKELIKLLNQNQ